MFGRDEPLPRRKVLGRALQIAMLFAKHSWALLRPSSRYRALPVLAGDLGPPFVKIGQLIAASPGSFPAKLVEALRGLHDDVQPQPFSATERVMRETWGSQWNELIELSDTPLAAGSVAQVHSGTLADGTSVAVKVQRGHITENIEAEQR